MPTIIGSERERCHMLDNIKCQYNDLGCCYEAWVDGYEESGSHYGKTREEATNNCREWILDLEVR